MASQTEVVDMGGRANAEAYYEARDRALAAVTVAENSLMAQAAWRLAKAHNEVANRYRQGRERLERHTPVPAGHAHPALVEFLVSERV